MRFRRRILLAVPAVLLGFCLMLFAQDNKGGYGSAGADRTGDKGNMMQDKKPGMPSPAEMEAMMKAATPGPEHAKMQEMAGTWEAKVQMIGPDGSPMGAPSNGTMKITPMMDGRYMMMNYEGTMDMGGGNMPFKGFGISGYDNVKKKYFDTWCDSMNTGLMVTEGNMEGDNKMVMTGKCSNPMTGGDCDVKTVMTKMDKDHCKYEMWMPGPDGKQMKCMEINYTRK